VAGWIEERLVVNSVTYYFLARTGAAAERRERGEEGHRWFSFPIVAEGLVCRVSFLILLSSLLVKQSFFVINVLRFTVECQIEGAEKGLN